MVLTVVVVVVLTPLMPSWPLLLGGGQACVSACACAHLRERKRACTPLDRVGPAKISIFVVCFFGEKRERGPDRDRMLRIVERDREKRRSRKISRKRQTILHGMRNHRSASCLFSLPVQSIPFLLFSN